MRRNHLFKPFTWWKLSPTYFGTLFVTKNLYESKTGIRQFVEGNIFENNWAMAQKGTAILFTPKNQYGKCPECAVHDIIFRYNILRHSVDGIGMAPVYATTCPGEAGGGTGNCMYLSGGLYNLSIHDNVLDDINESTYSPSACCSDGFLFNIQTDQPTNWPHDISIDHNTGFPVGSGIANVTIVAKPQVFANFSFENNLMTTGEGGFHQVLPGNKKPGCAAPTRIRNGWCAERLHGRHLDCGWQRVREHLNEVVEITTRKSASRAQFRSAKLRFAGSHGFQ